MRQRLRDGLVGATIAIATITLMSAPARADAIDGDWCNGGSHMHIDGDIIVTPARAKLKGRYTRYAFVYVVPEGEPGAGGEIAMVMIRGQEIVHLKRPGHTGEPEVWRRCKPIS